MDPHFRVVHLNVIYNLFDVVNLSISEKENTFLLLSNIKRNRFNHRLKQLSAAVVCFKYLDLLFDKIHGLIGVRPNCLTFLLFIIFNHFVLVTVLKEFIDWLIYVSFEFSQ